MADKILTDVTHMYKIQRLDGLFSTGGAHPKWVKKGRGWSTRADLSAHLRIVAKYGEPYPVGTKIVEYELEWQEVDSYLVIDHDPLVDNMHKTKCLRAIEVLTSNYPDCRYTMLREAVDLAKDVLKKEAKA